MVLSIPIDFCIEFWNSTFSPVLEYTEVIILTASARAFQWCKPRMHSCFRSKVIQVFLAPTQLRHTIVALSQCLLYTHAHMPIHTHTHTLYPDDVWFSSSLRSELTSSLRSETTSCEAASCCTMSWSSCRRDSSSCFTRSSSSSACLL